MPDTILNASSIFLPWVRQGAAATIQTADTLATTQPARISLPVKLRINDVQDVKVMMVGLVGPGEVTGLDPQQIVRTDPQRGTTTFEPNYLAGVEFDRPDLPWLFTPAKAGADGKLRPWLCLVVVKKQPGISIRSEGSASPPILEIGAPAKPGDELPDLAESWAWAHAQISGALDVTPEKLKEILRTRPELSVSRLLCPRLLQPNVEYLACLVPAFKAGLNLPLPPADTLLPAWQPTDLQVALPIYFYWEFRTGAAGDFESLVRLLTAREAPDGLGKRPMDISVPGFELPADPPPITVLELEGALRATNAEETHWPDPARNVFQQELKKIVNTRAANQGEPLVAPPIYGQIYTAVPEVSPGAVPLSWIHGLNLDPRRRVMAGFGTKVVQSQQEELMASAWEQAGEIERANQRLRQEQLNLAIATVLHVKHFQRLSEDALLQVAAPAQARLVWTDPAANGNPAQTMSLQFRIARAVVPSEAVTSATRRLTRSRGPISRRMVARGGPRMGGFIARLNRPGVGAPSQTGGAVTVNRISETIPALAQRVIFGMATEQALEAMWSAPVFRVIPEGGPMPSRIVFFAAPDNEAAKNFRAAARAHQAKVNPPGIKVFLLPKPPLPSLKTALLNRLDPAETVRLRVMATIKQTLPSDPLSLRPPRDPLQPILLAPEFPQPMYRALRDLSQDLLLPGLEHILPNTITLLETNAKFVESFMVGLNTEMGRELLWRGFPTDQRGTYFRQFWDGTNPDIEPIDQWGANALGENLLGAGPDENLVLLIRGDLLSRYPNAVIYAAEAVVDGKRQPGPNEKYPIFRGTLHPDVTFLGFDLTDKQAKADPGWFFIIQEQPTEPRFGFDEEISFGERTHVSVAQAPPAALTLPPGAVWAKNSAHMACITRQQPVRIAIHATQMIP